MTDREQIARVREIAYRDNAKSVSVRTDDLRAILALDAAGGEQAPADRSIAGRTLEEWTLHARRDDCLERMVPSDLRQLIGAISRRPSGKQAPQAEPVACHRLSSEDERRLVQATVDSSRLVESLPSEAQPAPGWNEALEVAGGKLDDIEVDSDDKCRWGDVANAIASILDLKRDTAPPSPAPAGEVER